MMFDSYALNHIRCTRAWALFSLIFGLTAALGSGIAESAPFAYVTHGNDTVTVIDTATHSVAREIKLSTGRQFADIAFSPDGKRLWLSDYTLWGTVTIVDAANDRVIRTMDLGDYPLRAQSPSPAMATKPI